MIDEIRRVALITSGVAELTRNRAELVVKDLVKAGDVGRDQASSLVKDLIERSKQNRAEFLRLIRAEIQSQIASLGVATSRDVERLERRVARLETSAKKTTAKRATAKRSAARKSTAHKAERPQAHNAPAEQPAAPEKTANGDEQKPPSDASGEQ